MRGKPITEARRATVKRSREKYPEKERARGIIGQLVRAKKIPRARELRCADCSRPAAHYDHHLGYGHPRDVQPVCTECHGKRDRVRGEHLRI